MEAERPLHSSSAMAEDVEVMPTLENISQESGLWKKEALESDNPQADKQQVAQEALKQQKEQHEKDFKKRTGMSPRRCFHLVLISLMLRLLGGGWIAMVSMEYARYYVVNDLKLLNVLQTATNSPQMAIQAFLFPLWGIVADRCSRKKVLVAATMAQCSSACLLTFIPCIEVYVFTRVLNLVSDIGGPIRDALLRDLFSDVEWESEGGGVTGIKSRMALIGGIASAASMAVGVGLLTLGKLEVGFLPNEYTMHKEECKGHAHCVPVGQFSFNGDWEVDGCLRLMMIMGSLVLLLDAFIVINFLPETIRPEHKRQGSLCSFIRSSWKDLGQPWNNLRVLATPQLRELMGIRELGYIIAAGGSSAFLSFYARFEFDTLTMYAFSASAMAAGWVTLFFIPMLVEKHGDLRGIWIPGGLTGIMFAGAAATLAGPVGHYLTFAVFPLLAGPSFALNGMAPELLAKQIPSGLQGTFQTGKSFIFRITQAIFLWPWMGLQVMTADMPYPFDASPLIMTVLLGVVALLLTIRRLPEDPKEAIDNGNALKEFWASDYVRGPWYKLHAGDQCEDVSEGNPSPREYSNPEFELNGNPEVSCDESVEADAGLECV